MSESVRVEWEFRSAGEWTAKYGTYLKAPNVGFAQVYGVTRSSYGGVYRLRFLDDAGAPLKTYVGEAALFRRRFSGYTGAGKSRGTSASAR